MQVTLEVSLGICYWLVVVSFELNVGIWTWDGALEARETSDLFNIFLFRSLLLLLFKIRLS